MIPDNRDWSNKSLPVDVEAKGEVELGKGGGVEANGAKKGAAEGVEKGADENGVAWKGSTFGPVAGLLAGIGGLESWPGSFCSCAVGGKVPSVLKPSNAGSPKAGSTDVRSLNTLYLSLATGGVAVDLKAAKLSVAALTGCDWLKAAKLSGTTGCGALKAAKVSGWAAGWALAKATKLLEGSAAG